MSHFARRPALRRLLCGAAVFALAACGQPADQAGTPEAGAPGSPILINVTAAAEATPGGILALAAMPREDEFWRGALFAAGGEGGVIAYDADGNVIVSQAGPRFTSLAAAPDFQLRGADLPLLAGIDATGAITVYAFSRDQSAMLETPTRPIGVEAAPRAICAGESSAAEFEIVTLGEAGGAELWRVRDTGEDTLAAERTAAFETPAPGRLCALNPETGELYIGMPGVGIVRLSDNGSQLGASRIDAGGMAFGVFAGRRRLVVTQPGGDVLMLDPETLEIAERASIIQGFSTPGVESPGAVTYTASTYGGAYPEGYLAIGDGGDGRPKFIDRGYIGRRLAEPVNPYAPGPAGAM